MLPPRIGSDLITGFAVDREFAAQVDLMLDHHPTEHRPLTEMEADLGDWVPLLSRDELLEGGDEFTRALRLWRETFTGWDPAPKTVGDHDSYTRQRWEHILPHTHPIESAYLFTTNGPRSSAYRDVVQKEFKQVFDRIVNSVQTSKLARSKITWVDTFCPTASLRDVFERLAGVDEAIRFRLGLDPGETGFLSRYAATLGQRIDARLHPRQFEYLVAELYEAEGWTCEIKPYSGDDGVDVIATREQAGEETFLLIQAKRYRSASSGRPARPVGVEEVRSFAATIRSHARDNGVLITTSRFTRGARRWAQGEGQLVANVKLVDGAELEQRLHHIAPQLVLRRPASYVFGALSKSKLGQP